MFLVGTRQVPVTEHDSVAVARKKGKARRLPRLKSTSHAPLRVSPGRLSAALAKTILTINPSSLDLAYQTVISFLGIQAWISGHGNELRLRSGFRDSHRDFSKATRTGELAQALTLILAQDHLGYPFVSDYYGFVSSLGLRVRRYQQTPDFVLWTPRSKTISLIESKGGAPSTKSTSVRSRLREGLKQTRHGRNELRRLAGPIVNRSYATLARFSEYGDPWGTELHYCDPRGDSREIFHSPHPVRRYYASWFAFLGFHLAASRLVEGDTLEGKKPEQRIRIDKREYLVLSESRLPVPTNVGQFSYPALDIENSPGTWQFALDEAVWDRLQSTESTPPSDWPVCPHRADGSTDLMIDGTAVMFSRVSSD